MPKLKENPQQLFYKNLTKEIESAMIYQGYSRKTLADRACINYGTLCKRLREPDTWILNELVPIMMILKMDVSGFYGTRKLSVVS